ncbi:hypothetical protein WICMUC_001254 [Wickerhamomyces mucosus]|uniref:Golgi apparatus membrane protein TVP15 n=1 Tax=Wickerhamomyces mucosus TaxID=1378264 RepID=A0A9P8PXB7_9ASCO|nr:hypothetical protein WICMUC_001254 [Wickerhamomyces mucosus]
MSDLNGIFKAVNLLVGLITAIWGFIGLFNLRTFFIAIYLLAFGVSIVLLEFQIPPLTQQYASFLFSFLGRGVFYILLGFLIIHDNVLRYLSGFIVVIIGIAYSILEFIPSVEVPDNFRIDAHVLADDEESEII